MGGIVWMGTTLTTGLSRSTFGVNFGTSGREALPDFCFLGPQRLGRPSRSTVLDMDLGFLFPVWTVGFWTTGGTVVSSSPLVIVFSLFFFMVAIPVTRNIKFKKKKKRVRKKRIDVIYFDE